MKRISLYFMSIFLSLAAHAQVTNYALHFGANDYASLGELTEMSGAESYTIQFWLNADEWTDEAVVMTMGDNFNIRLKSGESPSIKVIVGSTAIEGTSTLLGAGKWVHITIIGSQENNKVSLLVNNVVIATHDGAIAFPEVEQPMLLAIGYTGRMDEIRFWNTDIPSTFGHYWKNTVHRLCPEWSNMVAYYKCDQELCPDLVDYTYKHHGALSSGVSKVEVKDNTRMPYLIQAAYCNFSRLADRAVDRDKYLMANMILCIGVNTDANGGAYVQYPCNEGTLTNAQWLESFTDETGVERKGVVQFNGDGSKMSVGPNALTSSTDYSFHTWICIDEWTEGAYIFRKEKEDGTGFSIRLGADSTKQIIVRLNGNDYIRHNKMSVGKWVHLGVSSNTASQYPGEVFLFSFNGTSCYPTRGYFPSTLYSPKLPDLSGVEAIVGEGLKGKMDNTVIWKKQMQGSDFASQMTSIPVPAIGKSIPAAAVMHVTDSYWDYDRSDCPGYDNFSYRHYFNIMRSAAEGYRGQRFLISVSGHTNWENTFANNTKRKLLAHNLAEIANLPDFDGMDLDFEWTYSSSGWTNYAKLCQEIRSELNEGKLLTVTPHRVAYAYPTSYMQYVDYFLFQIYGPQKENFTYNTFTSAASSFLNHGYPRNKMILSYATTTSKGYNANGGQLNIAVTGYRNLYSSEMTADMNSCYDNANSCYRYFTGAQQTYDRSVYARDQRMAGIMYWDMGNDIPKTSDPLSIPVWSTYAIASNVDSLVTEVSPVAELPDVTRIAVPTISKKQSDVIFDLSGRALGDARLPKGVYVRAGKKYIVK